MNIELQPRGSHEGGISGEIDFLESHNRVEPIGRDLPPDGKELTGTVLAGALPNQKEGVQDENEAVFVDGE